MSIQSSTDEYLRTLRLGQKEYNELVQAGKSPNPAVLDEVCPDNDRNTIQDLGLLEIPSERIIGTKSAGRIAAFTPSFRPLLDVKSEFAIKWINLCEYHLGDTGITDPIVCYEYLGNFYVQEGNKRVSVLRYFGAPRIPALVKRVLPLPSEDPRVKAYLAFLDFYKVSRLYAVQFRNPRDYDRLLSFLGKEKGEVWTEDQRQTFQTYLHYFTDAFRSVNTKQADILPEEALLVWLQFHSFRELGSLSGPELKKSLTPIWEDILSAGQDTIQVQTEATEAKGGILNRIIAPEKLTVAFIHQLSPAASAWTTGHEKAADYLANTFGDQLTIHRYYDANTQERAAELIDIAVVEGAQVVFTTAPLLRTATLKASIRYPKVFFLNCSVDQPYSSFRSYYGRIFEAKFITGAVAGALSQNNRIGYIASYPIFGEPASVNAFALGAQLTNPRAQIELRWSCTPGSPLADFLADGIRVISNRDAPGKSSVFLDFCSYGTYLMDDRGGLVPLATPVWVWGKFYEMVLSRIFKGIWKSEQSGGTALNYWLGMDSGVIDIALSDRLPEGVRALAGILRTGLMNKTIDPFLRKIHAQDGSVKNDGTTPFTPDQLLHMDWLCDNVLGSIPSFEKILPISQPLVRELGIYRDSIPALKEASGHEDSGSL